MAVIIQTFGFGLGGFSDADKFTQRYTIYKDIIQANIKKFLHFYLKKTVVGLHFFH